MPTFTVTFTDTTFETVTADTIERTGVDYDFVSFFRAGIDSAVLMVPVLEIRSIRRHTEHDDSERHYTVTIDPSATDEELMRHLRTAARPQGA